MPEVGTYDAIILAVAHDEYRRMDEADFRAFGNPAGHLLYDLKNILPKTGSDIRL